MFLVLSKIAYRYAESIFFFNFTAFQLLPFCILDLRVSIIYVVFLYQQRIDGAPGDSKWQMVVYSS